MFIINFAWVKAAGFTHELFAINHNKLHLASLELIWHLLGKTWMYNNEINTTYNKIWMQGFIYLFLVLAFYLKSPASNLTEQNPNKSRGLAFIEVVLI